MLHLPPLLPSPTPLFPALVYSCAGSILTTVNPLYDAQIPPICHIKYHRYATPNTTAQSKGQRKGRRRRRSTMHVRIRLFRSRRLHWRHLCLRCVRSSGARLLRIQHPAVAMGWETRVLERVATKLGWHVPSFRHPIRAWQVIPPAQTHFRFWLA